MDNVTNVIVFAMTTACLGVAASVPGIVVGKWLATRGIVREAPRWLLAGGIVILFVLRLSFPHASLGWLVVGMAVFMPLGMYRQDLWTSIRRGRLPSDDG